MSYIRDLMVYEVSPQYSQWPSHGTRVNILRLRQNGCHFPDNIFKWIFVNGNAWILIKISLKFVPSDPLNNILALVEILAWCQPDDKPLFEPMMTYVIEAYMHRLASMSWLAWWVVFTHPDSKVHGANMGLTRVLSAPDGPHVGPMNLAIRADSKDSLIEVN